MTGKVMTFNKNGSADMIGQAIARSVRMVCDKIPPAYPQDNEMIAFIGADVGGGKLDRTFINFCEQLTSSRVKNAALFSASNDGSYDMAPVAEMLKKNGVNIVGDVYKVRQKTLFGKGPSEEDAAGAVEWAKAIMESLA